MRRETGAASGDAPDRAIKSFHPLAGKMWALTAFCGYAESLPWSEFSLPLFPIPWFSRSFARRVELRRKVKGHFGQGDGLIGRPSVSQQHCRTQDADLPSVPTPHSFHLHKSFIHNLFVKVDFNAGYSQQGKPPFDIICIKTSIPQGGQNGQILAKQWDGLEMIFLLSPFPFPFGVKDGEQKSVWRLFQGCRCRCRGCRSHTVRRDSLFLPVGSVAQEGIQGVGEDLCPVEENGMCHVHHLLHCKEVKHIVAAWLSTSETVALLHHGFKWYIKII